MTDGKISVIIPVYNVAAYLPQCLDSLLMQTYQNWEAICVDDGSTDESGRILDDYAARDPRFRVVHQSNAGAAAARNTGLQSLDGDYVSFIDSDDWLEPTMYETLASMFTSVEIDITACGYSMDYPDRRECICNHHQAPTDPMAVRDFLYYIYCRDEYRGVASYLWNKLFRARFFNGDTSRVRFDLQLVSQGDDIDAASKCYVLANQIVYTEQYLYHYRQRDNSAFQGSINRRLQTLHHLQAYENMIRLYEEHHIPADALDLVKRFYVYHAGLLLEYAYKIGATDKIPILKGKIRPYLEVYQRTNAAHPERYAWLQELLQRGNESSI